MISESEFPELKDLQNIESGGSVLYFSFIYSGYFMFVIFSWKMSYFIQPASDFQGWLFVY